MHSFKIRQKKEFVLIQNWNRTSTSYMLGAFYNMCKVVVKTFLFPNLPFWVGIFKATFFFFGKFSAGIFMMVKH